MSEATKEEVVSKILEYFNDPDPVALLALEEIVEDVIYNLAIVKNNDEKKAKDISKQLSKRFYEIMDDLTDTGL